MDGKSTPNSPGKRRFSYVMTLLPIVSLGVISTSAFAAPAKEKVRIISQADGGGGVATTDMARMTVRGTRPNQPPLFKSYSGISAPYIQLPIGGGGGGTAAPAQTSKEQETDDRQDDCPEVSGNPVVLYTGNKVEPELDFASQGEMGLYLQRTYNHHWSAVGIFGQHWLSNFDYSLAFSDERNLAWSQRPDGRRIKFLRDLSSGHWFEDKAQPVAYIKQNGDGSFTLHNEQRGTESYNAEGFITQQRDEQGVAWTYSYNNRYLQRVTHSSGRQINFSWSNGQLVRVTDPAGNAYQYTYTANAFGSNRPRLASAVMPGAPATTISYHYEDARFPGALTGKSFNGNRYSTFAYDASRRAVLSEHAGGVERFTYSYAVLQTEAVAPPPAPAQPGRSAGGTGSTPGSPWCEPRVGGEICYAPQSLPSFPSQPSLPTSGGPIINLPGVPGSPGLPTDPLSQLPTTRDRAVKISVTETNPLGRKTTYKYEDGRQVSVKGDASPKCAASYKERSYDANGYPDLVHDFADNLTNFDYSPQGFLLKQVEAVGTSAERTTTWEWDTGKNRLLKQRIVGDVENSFTYDAKGNLASSTARNASAIGAVGQSSVTTYTYTYHPNGLKASIKSDGPLAQDDVVETYSGSGDLLAVKNALGHTVSYSNYNGLGQPGRIVGVNGDVTEISYDARGRVASSRRSIGNDWATTTISYDPTGNLASILRPDGIKVSYSYDAAQRLVLESRPLGDGQFARVKHSYDNASNRTRTEISQSDYPADSQVVGYIDGVTHDGQWNWFVHGWACTTGSAASIQVDAYASGGVHIGSTKANRATGTEVANVCQASGAAYGFRVPITLAQRQQLGGRTVSVQGVSPQGATYNRALPSAADHLIPTATIIGGVSGVVQDETWNSYIEGWACSVGVAAPIAVHVYAGGAAGSGTHVASGTANLPGDATVAHSCQVATTAHRFRVLLDFGTRQAHANKTLHVHGISPVGQSNLVVTGSGSHIVPPATLSAQIISFNTSPANIVNGETTELTARVRNTGNIVWHSNTYLAWGFIHLNNSMLLSAPVPPGGEVVFSQTIAPENPGTGNMYFEYSAQMASSGTAWGPRATTGVTVSNVGWVCKPNGECQAPMSVEPGGQMLKSTEGER